VALDILVTRPESRLGSRERSELQQLHADGLFDGVAVDFVGGLTSGLLGVSPGAASGTVKPIGIRLYLTHKIRKPQLLTR
jgi:hypothetical protein